MLLLDILFHLSLGDLIEPEVVKVSFVCFAALAILSLFDQLVLEPIVLRGGPLPLLLVHLVDYLLRFFRTKVWLVVETLLLSLRLLLDSDLFALLVDKVLIQLDEAGALVRLLLSLCRLFLDPVDKLILLGLSQLFESQQLLFVTMQCFERGLIRDGGQLALIVAKLSMCVAKTSVIESEGSLRLHKRWHVRVVRLAYLLAHQCIFYQVLTIAAIENLRWLLLRSSWPLLYRFVSSQMVRETVSIIEEDQVSALCMLCRLIKLLLHLGIVLVVFGRNLKLGELPTARLQHRPVKLSGFLHEVNELLSRRA